MSGKNPAAGGIVLCGGQSRRMGLPKASLPFGSEAMLPRVVRLLGSIVEPIVVVAAPAQALPSLPAGVHIARDEQEGLGPLQGIAAGLHAMKPFREVAYVTGCDVPLLVPDFVGRLLGMLGDHEIVVPEDSDYAHPLAAVYRTSVLGEVERLLQEERYRPAFLFESCDTRRVRVDQLRDVDPALTTLRNLNRPADYLAALRSVGLEPSEEIIQMLDPE